MQMKYTRLHALISGVTCTKQINIVVNVDRTHESTEHLHINLLRGRDLEVDNTPTVS